MNISDIQEDLARGDITALREAFRALACAEYIIVDENGDTITPEQRKAFLKAVSDHLTNDNGTVPPDACHALNLPTGVTYGSAAAFLVAAKTPCRPLSARLSRAATMASVRRRHGTSWASGHAFGCATARRFGFSRTPCFW